MSVNDRKDTEERRIGDIEDVEERELEQSEEEFQIDINIDLEKIEFGKIFDDEFERDAEFLSLGKPKTFLRGDVVQKKLGIKERTLTVLAESGEFALGRVGGVKVILADTFFDYLDRHHYKKRESPDEPIAIDPKGRIKEHLTYVGKKHTKVPTLRPIKDFAADLGVEERTFLRHCEIGTFPHYRIASLYKMSEEDYTEALKKIALSGMKSNRGGRPKKQGRPYEIYGKINKRFSQLVKEKLDKEKSINTQNKKEDTDKENND